MDWQPIETAPKDGTVVDLWVSEYEGWPEGGSERLAKCMWVEDPYGDGDEFDQSGWYQSYAEIESFGNKVDKRARVTHWMPLPEPPK